MGKRNVSVNVLLFAMVCTAICAAMASQWYFVHQKAGGYKAQLTAKIISNDGNQLIIKGDVTNPKGTNGTYTVKYRTELAVCDSAGNEMTFADLQPESRISVFYHWSIPKYVSPYTEFEDLFALEDGQTIPDVSAIAGLSGNESGKPIDFVETRLSTP